MQFRGWVALGAAVLSMGIAASSASAADLYIATTGVNSGNCQSQAAPCSSINYAQSQASATGEADTIHFAAGEYVPDVNYLTVPNITYAGPQAGVPAQDRAGPEAILDVPNGGFAFIVQADNLIFDGLKFQSQDYAASNGSFALYNLNPATVRNVIFTHVLTGLYAGSGINLSNSTFDSSNDAMYATGTSTVIDNVRFSPANAYAGLVSGASGPLTMTNSTFTSGTYGFLTYTGSATVQAHGNSFSPSIPNALYNDGSPLDASDNWWGCNAGANTSGCASKVGPGGGTLEPHLVLTGTATPNSVHKNDTVDLAGTLSVNSVGTDTGYKPVATRFTFGANQGAASPTPTTFTSGVFAHSTLSGLAVAQPTIASVAAGNQVVSLPIDVFGDPILDASPTNLDFGSVARGTSSTPQDVTVRNTGDGPMTVTSVVRSGTGGSQFGVSNTCVGTPIAAGSTCTVSVAFAPTVVGSYTPSVTIRTNAGDQVVALSGTATGVIPTLSSSSIAFGDQQLTTTSSPHTVTLTNAGNIPMTLSSIVRSGTGASAFTATRGCPTGPIAPGASCDISVTFAPTALGAISPALTLNGNFAAQTVSLSGTGVPAAPQLAVSPSSLSFGSVARGTISPSQPVTVTNTGTAGLKVTGVTRSGTGASRFDATNGCTAVVAPGASCTIGVTFAPTGVGELTPLLTITTNAGSAAVALSGTGF
jgi:hypothetical protein